MKKVLGHWLQIDLIRPVPAAIWWDVLLLVGVMLVSGAVLSVPFTSDTVMLPYGAWALAGLYLVTVLVRLSRRRIDVISIFFIFITVLMASKSYWI